MAKELFGTDGIRGIPGTAPLDAPTLAATGRSLGHYLKREHGSAHVLIGMDTRESGPHLGSVLAAGLRQAGASVAFAGVITTPGVACLVRQNDFQAGVVISASHNPFQDRKSTRLNSSHVAISYAVFCLKKKKTRRLAQCSPIIY